MECEDIYAHADEGDQIEIQPSTGKVSLPEKAVECQGLVLPDFLLEIIQDGGLIPHIAAKSKAA
jgi:3-isopropylmalate/(R)-2-methylmalate dehydratase small subunit